MLVKVNHTGSCGGYSYEANKPVNLPEEVLKAIGSNSYIALEPTLQPTKEDTAAAKKAQKDAEAKAKEEEEAQKKADEEAAKKAKDEEDERLAAEKLTPEAQAKAQEEANLASGKVIPADKQITGAANK